jgi:citrate lyase subunit beta/citryl-CoA lyase
MTTEKQPTDLLATASTLLFVSALRPERFARALASGASMVVLDLEDAVAPVHRHAAREILTSVLAEIDHTTRARLLVRINAAGSSWHAADAQAAAHWMQSGLAGVMLPKADSATVLTDLATRLAGSDQASRRFLIPLIESAAGLAVVEAIAATSGVSRLAFGHLDFMADLGMACEDDEAELVPARFALVQASSLAGIAAPIDGVTVDVRDLERLARDAGRSVRMGFGGKLCIHPDQIATARQAFRPSDAQLAWALRVVVQADAGEALFMLDGRMVDAPVIALARRILERSH